MSIDGHLNITHQKDFRTSKSYYQPLGTESIKEIEMEGAHKTVISILLTQENQLQSIRSPTLFVTSTKYTLFCRKLPPIESTWQVIFSSQVQHLKC